MDLVRVEKAVLSTIAILAVIMALGYGHTWLALWILPLGFLVGLVFGGFGLVMNALAPGYDFFTYFFTLVLTPMLLFSGVYFPVDQMPPWLAGVANFLPLKHVDATRAASLMMAKRAGQCRTARSGAGCSTRSLPTTPRSC